MLHTRRLTLIWSHQASGNGRLERTCLLMLLSLKLGLLHFVTNSEINQGKRYLWTMAGKLRAQL
jgi:hypothetical protein